MTSAAVTRDRAAERAGLGTVIASPIVWSVHFMICYVTAAIWCAKAGDAGDFWILRATLGGYTVAALALVGWVGLRGYQRHRRGRAEPPHDQGTVEDRVRFLGYASLLLSLLSAVAIAYSGVTIFFFRSCL
jgi:hypothetical protein